MTWLLPLATTVTAYITWAFWLRHLGTGPFAATAALILFLIASAVSITAWIAWGMMQ